MAFDFLSSSSKTSASDSRQAGTDAAQVLRGTSIGAKDKAKVASGKGKILAKGATDLSGAKVQSGIGNNAKVNTGKTTTTTKTTKNTIVGNKGSVTVGDPNAAATVSTTATNLADKYLAALNQANTTAAQTLATVTTNIQRPDNSETLTTKLLDVLSSNRPAAAPDPTTITVPSAPSGADLSSFINSTVGNALAEPSVSARVPADSAKSGVSKWLWAAVAVLLLVLLVAIPQFKKSK